MKSINPHDGALLTDYGFHSENQLQSLLQRSHDAFQKWSSISVEERVQPLEKLSTILKSKSEELGQLVTQEMGKPLSESKAEVEKCSKACDYYFSHAADFLASKKIVAPFSKTEIHYQPLGVILGVMPWNFPFWQVLRFAVPTLSAGNSVLLKHAENVQGCAEAIESLFNEAGFPPDLFLNSRPQVEQISGWIADDRVRGVSLTGSTRAGRSVAELAGKNLKRTVLELGGSDPQLVLKDADLKMAVRQLIKGRFLNAGQSCISAKRILLDSTVEDEFRDLFLEEAKKIIVGDPRDSETRVGPLARKDLRDHLQSQVDKSLELGASLLYRSETPKNDSKCYYPVTVLGGVRPGMPAFDDELFGPVASLIQFESEEEGFELANHTHYGLGSAVFTRNPERVQKQIEGLQAGSTFINHFVQSHPALPFGGVKDSGWGRELSDLGLYEFTNRKTLCYA